MEVIILRNRNNRELVFTPISSKRSECKYLFDPKEFRYIRHIFNSDNETIHSIDPEGGPMISIGEDGYLKGYVLCDISYKESDDKYILTFKKK